VGWFTSLYPLVLRRPDADPDAHLRVVKEQVRQIRHGGAGYGALRYLAGDLALAARGPGQARAEVVFNYLGQLDQVLGAGPLVGATRAGTGPVEDARNVRAWLLEITAWIAQGRLHAACRYSVNLHRAETIATLLSHWRRSLERVARHALSLTPPPSAADFPLAGLTEAGLDTVLNAIRAH
jgi:non-ribosomal peptide synthase protein (TIGR01720 family)